MKKLNEKKKKNHFSKLCWSSDKSQVVGLAILNVFQGKTLMKWKNQSLNMTLILWSLNESKFSTPVFNSKKDSSNSQNIMFNGMSESKKLYWALTNVYLENRGGTSLQVGLN